MLKKTSHVNFKSNIKLITPQQFAQKTKTISKELCEVDFPWTPAQTKSGKILFTQKIMDCVAGGITGKKTSKLFHQGHWTEEKAKEHSQKVFDIKVFEQKLLEGVNLANENVHGFIIGGFKNVENEFTNQIKNVFKKNNIPFTEFTTRKNVHHYGKYSLLYEHDTDTWNITSTLIDAKAPNGRDTAVKINGSSVDFITYGKSSDGYPMFKNTGTAEDFLKSQFENVSLCRFDKFI